jgi:hypothetical protein
MRDYIAVVRRDSREELAYFVTAASKAAARESYKNGEGSLLKEERVEVLDGWIAAVYEVPQLRAVLPLPAAKRVTESRTGRASQSSTPGASGTSKHRATSSDGQ